MASATGRAIGTAQTLSEYLGLVDQKWQEWIDRQDHIADIWFRGQADRSWSLVPGVYRKECRKSKVHECRYRHEFCLRAQPFLGEAASPPRTDWEWYFLMQHFGVPTRLLDWTESALVALYFAVQRGSSEADGCVWVLCPRAVNKHLEGMGSFIPIYSDESVRAYLPPLWDKFSTMPLPPAAIDPPLNSSRLAAQRGKCTIHGASHAGLDECSQLDEYLARINIPADAKGDILRQLMSAGITEGVLFPGLAGLGREIRNTYTREFDVRVPKRTLLAGE